MITDPDVQILAEISRALQANYVSEDADWQHSPFGCIRRRPSRQRGAIGEGLVAGWLAARGFNVTRACGTGAYRVVEDKPTETELCTLWASGGYRFQQIRDQDYDLVICPGVSPFTAHRWVIPKAELMRLWKVEHEIRGQHRGSAGTDTAWIEIKVSAPPDWIEPFGGSLAQGVAALSRLTGFEPPPLRECPEGR